ncbi:MAG: molecular chaperone TorD family protein [Desulfobacterales bacterium]|nr:molecular chaperone TorD family protein [Desulfobacterales bacterium]
MTVEERLKEARIKAEGYRLLAECYYPPDERLGGLIDDLASCLTPLCPEAATHIQAMQPENLSEQDLIGDYARLFLGPFSTIAPPYGSVYLDPANGVMGSSTAHVRDCYLEMGLDISESFQEAPDHISVELEFMHFLCIKEAEAASRSDAETALYFFRKQADFLEGCLSWSSEFADRVRAQARTGFYRSLAECTRIFIGISLERDGFCLRSASGSTGDQCPRLSTGVTSAQ